MMISARQELRCDNDVHNLQRYTKACKLVMKHVWFAPHTYHHHPEKLLPSYRATKLLKFTNCGLALPVHSSWVQSIYQLGCHEIRFSAELLWLNPPPNYDMPSFDMAHGNSALNWTSVLTNAGDTIRHPRAWFTKKIHVKMPVNWQGFSKWLLNRRRLCFPTIRCQVWKFWLTNMDFNMISGFSSFYSPFSQTFNQ